jgi:hypothetical protein
VEELMRALSLLRRSTFIALLLLAVSLAMAPAVSAADDRHDERDADERRADERGADIGIDVDVAIEVGARPPPIAEVLETAYTAAGLDRDPTPSWRRRARVAGLIQWVTVRTGWDANWREEETDVGRRRTFEVRATWRLDRLLFDGRELQMSTIDAARRRERRRLASRVIQAYFSWRKVSARAARDGRFALAAEAATAELDALTDGWFSEMVSDRGKSAR